MKYTPSQASALIQHIRNWSEKCDYSLEVKRVEAGRNEDQQALLHVTIRNICKQAGCGEDWFKQEFMKKNSEGVYPFWPHDIQKDINGKSQMVPKSESKLTKREESEQIERLNALAAEWGYEVAA